MGVATPDGVVVHLTGQVAGSQDEELVGRYPELAGTAPGYVNGARLSA